MASTSQNPHDIEHVPVLFTPLGELLFYERVNEVSTRSDGKQTKRAIGDAHPKASRWPNHKLAGIAPDPDEGWTRYFYAADRANQHQYNWEVVVEGSKRKVRQTYVLKRTEVDRDLTATSGRMPGYYLPDTLENAYHQDQAGTVRMNIGSTTSWEAGDPFTIVSGDNLTANGAADPGTLNYMTDKTATGILYSIDGADGAVVALTVDSGAGGENAENIVVRYGASIRPALPGQWSQERAEVRAAPPELAGLYVVVVVTWANAVSTPLEDYELDELTGQVLPISRRMIRRAEAYAVAADMDGDGLYTVTEPIDDEWAWAITRKASSLAGVTAGRTYDSTTSGYTWPMVLGTGTAAQVLAGTHSGIAYYVWNQAVTGGTRIKRIQFFVVPDKPPFSGASKITVQERWSATKFTISAPAQPQPRRIFWDTGFGVLNVAPCLHGEWDPVPSFTTSSDDVDHPLVTSPLSSFYAATTTLSDNTTACADWPESFVLSDEQQPYRGGFLRRTVTIFRPYS